MEMGGDATYFAKYLAKPLQPSATPHARVKPRQLHAHLGASRGDQTLVADLVVGKAGEDWGQDRWPISAPTQRIAEMHAPRAPACCPPGGIGAQSTLSKELKWGIPDEFNCCPSHCGPRGGSSDCDFREANEGASKELAARQGP